MRIHFDNVFISSGAGSRTGPNVFAERLARELMRTGHEIVDHGPDADVSLIFIERSGQPLAKYTFQRLDGIWFKPDEYHTKNVGILETYRSVNTTIFQSEFDFKMVKKWWGAPRNGGAIIHNGIDLTRVDHITIPKLAKIRSTYDKVFVCSSNWHPQKRLRDNLRLFDHLRRTQFPNSCLFVMGANPDVMTTDPHVLYTGSQPPEVYLQVFAIADWMFHLAWADHCPNVVIEALSQGTPVICSEVGGTRELIGGYGRILKEDPYDFDLVDYDRPPAIDVTQVSQLPSRHELDYASIPNIDIADVARRYVNLFKKWIFD